MIDIGRVAYEAYVVNLNTVLKLGFYVPKWEHIGKDQQDSWRAAACGVWRALEAAEK